ncbi:Methylenetetrahydrofolate--tRNA-(uracil-5-)-methyltransferase [Frankliniella fusca]|uniref:Methylenetetrahydrofolate--tRNA-(Uracil-5-)-methyltransferase n=1 Tax=Frankliniella fusca TaxID=407009 RepID=A0AAE1LQR2_9NEOP|nr:Methylenetetrahydrofolate--tRNA-(uracil-5-)-methyltransferase [Frankliniella fusca]
MSGNCTVNLAKVDLRGVDMSLLSRVDWELLRAGPQPGIDRSGYPGPIVLDWAELIVLDEVGYEEPASSPAPAAAVEGEGAEAPSLRIEEVQGAAHHLWDAAAPAPTQQAPVARTLLTLIGDQHLLRQIWPYRTY